MVYRFKFRVRSKNSAAEKYVFTLEEGREIFLDPTFQPSPVHTDSTCFFLSALDGKATLHFLCDGILWNGEPAPKGSVDLHPGHLIQGAAHTVEILECPESHQSRNHTKFVDVASLREGAFTTAPTHAPAYPHSPPQVEAALRKEPRAQSPFRPIPASSLASPDSVARPEPGDTFDPDSFPSPFAPPLARSIPFTEPPRYLDPRRKSGNAVALAVVALMLGIAAIVFASRYRG